MCSDKLSICSVLSFETIFSASYLSASLEACWTIEKKRCSKEGTVHVLVDKTKEGSVVYVSAVAVALAAAETVAAAATVVVGYWN